VKSRVSAQSDIRINELDAEKGTVLLCKYFESCICLKECHSVSPTVYSSIPAKARGKHNVLHDHILVGLRHWREQSTASNCLDRCCNSVSAQVEHGVLPAKYSQTSSRYSVSASHSAFSEHSGAPDL
jgi:hypothetical protein